MTPIYQTRPTTTRKVGNCFEACFASILDKALSDIPDMSGNAKEGETVSPEDAKAGMDWLSRRGLGYVEIGMPGPLEDLLITMGRMQPLTAYILTGRTASRSLHSVVARGGEIIHDPAGRWNDKDIIVRPVDKVIFRVGFVILLL